MQNKRNKKRSSLILSMMLIVAMALGTTACSDNHSNKNSEVSSQLEKNTESPLQSETNHSSQSDSEENVDTENSSNTKSDVTILGEGNTIFPFTVVDEKGNETVFEIHTNKTTVGDALLELGLIAGEQQMYGLYVKTVNGITADYDIDGTYWGFYVNGEYAMSGVDTTTITEGDSYSFKVSK